ncbi:MAG: bifunctional phosphoribosylaminoimidazolecarboxamide formyltransferase/IMP cyclohydrolase [Candidatus Promineifilaceae bacterium]
MPRAILSVYDKTGLLPLAQGLASLGWELVASGGTARSLREAGLAVLDVSELTGAPEMIGGRVKTLHPAIHAAILAQPTTADMDEIASYGLQPISLVVCNLYPFLQTVTQPGATVADAVEQIDIGGVTLLRAAAKNFARVTVVCDPDDYDAVLAALSTGDVDAAMRQRLAAKAFAHTRDYDIAIAAYLAGLSAEVESMPAHIALSLSRIQLLRYGENPHQNAALYAASADSGPLGGTLLQGKPLSYNNLLDLDAAWAAAASFAEPAVAIVKHLSPCGIAVDETIAAAFAPALASDPVSAFGGVIGVNRPVDSEFVMALAEANLFVEAVAAPGFSAAAQEWFAARKKSCRLLVLPDAPPERWGVRSVRGGFLVQEVDYGDPPAATWQIVTQQQPTESEWQALRFAWQACRHVKSNAIVFARQKATVGIGGGLPSRVDAVRLAIAKAGDSARGAVMASDAFFPFADGIMAAADAGITAIIQPGGSVRDDEVIATADQRRLAMVFTGARHFKH